MVGARGRAQDVDEEERVGVGELLTVKVMQSPQMGEEEEDGMQAPPRGSGLGRRRQRVGK